MKNEENKIDIPSTVHALNAKRQIIFPTGRRLHISAMVELPFIFCMVFYWKAHFSKPLSAEDFNPIKRGTLNVSMGHRFYQGAKKLSKSWEVVRRDGHFAFKNILYGIFK